MMAKGFSGRCYRRWYGDGRRWNVLEIGSMEIKNFELLCSSVVLKSVKRVRFMQRDADEEWSWVRNLEFASCLVGGFYVEVVPRTPNELRRYLKYPTLKKKKTP